MNVLPQFFLKNKKLIVLALVTLFLVWAITYSSKPREQVTLPEKVIGYIVLPVQKAVDFVRGEFNSAYYFFHEIGAEKDQKQKLSLRVQDLESQLVELNDLRKENNRLNQLLALNNELKGQKLESVPAQVIGRNPDNLNNMIITNKGSNDGVKLNDTVISLNKGLVGRVIEVSTNWSKVLLITDPESSVSSMIDRTRELTVAQGDSFASKYGYIKLTYILPTADIITDDIIITSGFGGIFSKGILIGKVKEVKQEPKELTKYAYVEPTADFKTLEEVIIIKTSAQNSPSKEGKR